MGEADRWTILVSRALCGMHGLTRCRCRHARADGSHSRGRLQGQRAANLYGFRVDRREGGENLATAGRRGAFPSRIRRGRKRRPALINGRNMQVAH